MVTRHNQPVRFFKPTGISEPIQMVDLKGQYMKNKEAINAAIQACLDSSSFIKGPQVDAFEQLLASYLHVGHVVSCANGTDALQLALMALNLVPGDEVIVPAFTYIATAEVIALLGLKPVIVDVDPHTFTLTASHVAEAITPRTKAVMPVHLFGQCADMSDLLRLCQTQGLAIIEDAAQSIGALYTFPDGRVAAAGTLGAVGTTSFFPSKNLGCFGDGGAVYTNSSLLAQRINMLANHGQSRKYYHDIVGINSRLDSLQAAILIEKLSLLPQYTQARQQVADLYDQRLKGLDGIQTPYRASYSSHVFHQYTLTVGGNHRDSLKEYLSQHGIPSMIYYPLPLSQQKAYQGLGRVVGQLSVTEELCQSVLSLPMHTELSVQQVDYITDVIRSYFA
ncbi:MAG TPA: DegT/DnrJ/EryC1/StrS family aminotransferase [Fibrella sp.]